MLNEAISININHVQIKYNNNLESRMNDTINNIYVHIKLSNFENFNGDPHQLHKTCKISRDAFSIRYVVLKY